MAAAGAATTVGLTGCLGILDGGGGGPEGAVRNAFRAALDGDVEQYDELLHSRSPNRPIDEEAIGSGTNSENLSYEITSTETVAEDPTEATVRERFGGRATTEEEVQTLVSIVGEAADTALVGLTIEATLSLGGEERTETSESTVLVATEDGDWKVVTATAENGDQGDTGN